MSPSYIMFHTDIAIEMMKLKCGVDKVENFFSASKFHMPPDRKKDLTLAHFFRMEGNKAYTRRSWAEAACLYNTSIMRAPSIAPFSLELAYAFANRSAVSFSQGKYEACLRDVEHAFNTGYVVKHKLLRRRAECHRHMNNMDEARASYEEAIKCCSEEATKQSLEQDLAALKPPDREYKPQQRPRPLPELYLGENPLLPGASACLAIKFSETYGRHLVATKDIPPGMVLMIEKPYACVLNPDKLTEYCSHCMLPVDSFIPCNVCSRARYCNESCRDASWESSHELECRFLSPLTEEHITPNVVLLVLRMFFIALKKLGSLEALCTYITGLEKEVFEGIKGCDPSGRYESSELRAIYNMAQNIPDTSETKVERIALRSFLADIVKDGRILTGQSTEIKIFGSELLLRYLRIQAMNSFGLRDCSVKPQINVGVAIYSSAALFNHQCVSNAFRYTCGDTIVFMSNHPIAKGEQVFICYTEETLLVRDLRNARKKSSWMHFTCECSDCKGLIPSETFVPLCPKCGAFSLATLGQERVKCDRCKSPFNASKIVFAAVEMIRDISFVFSQPWDEGTLTRICRLITEMHKIVVIPPKHRVMVQHMLESLMIARTHNLKSYIL